MSKLLFRIFSILFFSLSTLAVAQDEPPKQEQTSEEDFFDLGDAPVSYKGAFTKMMLTLLALIILIVISVWMLRRISHGRMKQMNYGRAIKVIERRPLSAKSVLYLVEISGKKVVIAESQVEVRGITTADHLTDE
ncbi:MAG: flagellar biosynthetic protein FliO [Simkaniaceae bacterium]|nr:flagellar biosynthetic protein FliO [Candidatus Sacchlamyda saccharinae]